MTRRNVTTMILCFLSAAILDLSSSCAATSGGGLPDPRATPVTFSPRSEYGRPLEPTGVVLHGAGQSRDAFLNYTAALGAGRRPAVYKAYVGLKYSLDGFFRDLATACDDYETQYGVYLIPEIGLSMTTDGAPDESYETAVAAGDYDDRIDAFCDGLGALGRPAFVRIGYECNGSWNGYVPADFIQAWIRITAALRDPARNLQAATVWCVAHPLGGAAYQNWYPGDEYVDWWSIDLFSAGELSSADTYAFLDAAHAHGRPVMIAETTPRYVGVTDGQADWDAWFEPFFALIQTRPGIKAFSYINWNWAEYPQWSDWGDARLEQNAQVQSNYRFKTASSLYLHGADEQTLRAALGAADATPPGPPTGLTAVFNDHVVDLAWTAPAGEPNIVRYEVYRNGAAAGRSAVTAFTDRDLSSGALLSYTVRAVDAGGNEGPDSSPAAVALPDTLEKIGNREFDDGTALWSADYWQGGAAVFTIDNTNQLSGANSGRLAVTGTGTNWHVQLRQAFTTRSGKTYRLRFQAMADVAAPVTVMLQQSHDPFGNILSRNVTLTGAAQSFDFTNSGAPADDSLYVTFMLGQADGRTIWIDNVSLEESE